MFAPIERVHLPRSPGVDAEREQRWTVYARSLLAFSLVSVLFVYLLQRVQGGLPLNPTDVAAVPEPLAFNTAVSFVTNTNWQNYAGEITMSHLTQMAGLAVQNFVSAAVGMAVAIALVRGLVRRRSATIGNFWVDLTRSITRILLPISVIGALVLVSQGVIQNFDGFTVARTLEGAVQLIPGGPAASQEVIKELGTNGGGFLNANSGHPFGSPNGFTNLFQMFLILAIPFALTYTFGKMAQDRKQGWAVFGAMFILWAASALIAQGFETGGNPELDALGADQDVAAETAGGGNYEGKEVRFGPGASGLFAATTTGTSTGAVIAAHDSFTPGGGAVPLVNMMLGEVSPGGVGAGLYGMLIFALLSVFIAGLMVGPHARVPGQEDPGGRDEADHALHPAHAGGGADLHRHLGGDGHVARRRSSTPGPHGLTEVTYAFTSAGNNNGSAFGGLTGNTDWYNTTLGLAMLCGRFLLIVPAAGPGRLAGPQADRAAVERHLPDRTPRCSSACWSASC